ncbi:hypothetical protein LW138_07010, partial [Helicobacter sp. faydin-H17]|nr:hypothetical protein [Helicobacter kayseriensis]MCE3049183.1 hypothetical protein [Helicobacter kayseriensis]
LDGSGDVTRGLYEEIKAGKLLDPREPKSTKESREEFRKDQNAYIRGELNRYDFDKANDRSESSFELYTDTLLLEAKIMAVTPPQGYINAPYYYFPEELDELYKAGKLDRKLDPRIPAIRRVGFPQELVKKIEEFARSKK